ncbi:MAG: chemotaxis protein CheB [Sphingobacteriales bacterium]|nr:MAG: chemotaxis protein CheB [Sphingobacteriales bacterium]
MLPGTIYIAPADYHVLVEHDHTFSLDYSEKVNFSRPSIDVTFQTAAEVYRSNLVCLLLSGSSADGVAGLIEVKKNGGMTAIQEPSSAGFSFMPAQAAEHAEIDKTLEIEDIQTFINELKTN